MIYEETMRDEAGDKITVQAWTADTGDYNRVNVSFEDDDIQNPGALEGFVMSLTADNARKLAGLINRAAARVEIAKGVKSYG